MTLIERSDALRERINALGKTQDELNEEEDLKEFCNAKLARPMSRLKSIERCRTAFAVQSLPWSRNWVPDSLAPEVRDLLADFKKTPNRATLLRPDAWPALEPKLLSVLAEAEKKALANWSEFCATKVPKEHPDELRNDPVIGLHESNLSLLDRFETLYKSLARLSSIAPEKPADISQFLEIANEAYALLAQLNREPPLPEEMPPDEVQRFLAAVSLGPVSLDLVTPVVLTWLGERERLKAFEVKTKSA